MNGSTPVRRGPGRLAALAALGLAALLAACAAPPAAPAETPSPAPRCGDGRCEAGEDAAGCPADCAPPTEEGALAEAAPGMALFEPISLTACGLPLCERGELGLSVLLGHPPSAGLLGARHVAVDPLRNLVYVGGGLTPRVGVLSSATGSWAASLDPGANDVAARSVPLVDPGAGVLYLLNSQAQSLMRIELGTGRVAGPVPLSPGENWAGVDTRRERLLVMSGTTGTLTAYGGSALRMAFVSQSAGAGAGPLAYDETGDQVFVLDRLSLGATPAITRLDAGDGRFAGEIRFSAPAGERAGHLAWDPAGRRFVVGFGSRLLVVDEQGTAAGEIVLPNGEQLEALALDPVSAVVAALTRHADRPDAAALHLFDLASREARASWPLPPRVGAPAANPTAARFYLADPDLSQLWSVAADGGTAPEALWLGDSADQLTVVGGGRALVIASRRGGGSLLALELAAGRLETVAPGEGLYPIGTDEQQDELLALDARRGELVVSTVGPGFEESVRVDLEWPLRTPADSVDLAVHPRIELAYVISAQAGQLLAVDWPDRHVVARADLPPGMIEPPPGPGGLQLAVDDESGRVFVLRTAAPMRLATFDLRAELALLADVGLAGAEPAAWGGGGPPRLLFADPPAGRAFAGPYEVDAASGQPTGRMLARGERVIASDARAGWLLAVARAPAAGDGAHEALVWLEAATLGLLHEELLGPADDLPLVFAFDGERGALYVGWPAAGRIRILSLGPLD